MVGSRITPSPLEACSLPASNCGLISAMVVPFTLTALLGDKGLLPWVNQVLIVGKRVLKDMKEASTVTRSTGSDNRSTNRAFVSSITTTRRSCRSFQCRIPLPTSMEYTRLAPFCSRQSVKPPVDAPTSAQISPSTEMWKSSRAAASFSPPRDTNLGPFSISIFAFCSMFVDGLRATSPFTRTWPAITNRCAIDRLSTNPRSNRTKSRRVLFTGVF